MAKDDDDNAARKWAHFRFMVVGPILGAPPKRGQLRAALEAQAKKVWTHPTTGEPVSFGVSTVERWYYAAKNEPRDPVGVLRRKVRKDAGEQPSVGDRLRRVLAAQYREHPGWTKQLHYDNVVALAEEDGSLGSVPSYTTVRRYMVARGWVRKRKSKKRGRDTEGTRRAARRLEQYEVRSYEVSHVGALWHTDYHNGSLEVLEPDGLWYVPKLFCVLDDRSRLGAHAQWYIDDESTESFVDGLCQGFQKYDLPRSLMSDNGGAMRAEETRNGLLDLGIIHETTLPESPYQNGKQESFWNQIEGRLLAMLEGVKELTLELLNEATQAWLHLEYNRTVHDEIGMSPLRRFLDGPSVLRPCPSSDVLRRAFRRRVGRTQRRSDGTISIEGVRFEIPSRYRQLERVVVRYAYWDLARVDMIDPKSDQVLTRLLPQNKERNADGHRRRLAPVTPAEPIEASGRIAPLLQKMMKEYAATGLPPAYLPRRFDPPEKE